MRPTRAKAALAATLLLTLAAGLGGGCVRPLLSPEETRSPFDSYDSVRGQYSPQKVFNESGQEKPNLRQRLSNKG